MSALTALLYDVLGQWSFVFPLVCAIIMWLSVDISILVHVGEGSRRRASTRRRVERVIREAPAIRQARIRVVKHYAKASPSTCKKGTTAATASSSSAAERQEAKEAPVGNDGGGAARTTEVEEHRVDVCRVLIPASMRVATKSIRHRVVVVVGGDFARSPRMQYHAMSLARSGWFDQVTLVGFYEGNALSEALLQCGDPVAEEYVVWKNKVRRLEHLSSLGRGRASPSAASMQQEDVEEEDDDEGVRGLGGTRRRHHWHGEQSNGKDDRDSVISPLTHERHFRKDGQEGDDELDVVVMEQLGDHPSSSSSSSSSSSCDAEEEEEEEQSASDAQDDDSNRHRREMKKEQQLYRSGGDAAATASSSSCFRSRSGRQEQNKMKEWKEDDAAAAREEGDQQRGRTPHHHHHHHRRRREGHRHPPHSISLGEVEAVRSSATARLSSLSSMYQLSSTCSSASLLSTTRTGGGGDPGSGTPPPPATAAAEKKKKKKAAASQHQHQHRCSYRSSHPCSSTAAPRSCPLLRQNGCLLSFRYLVPPPHPPAWMRSLFAPLPGLRWLLETLYRVVYLGWVFSSLLMRSMVMRVNAQGQLEVTSCVFFQTPPCIPVLLLAKYVVRPLAMLYSFILYYGFIVPASYLHADTMREMNFTRKGKRIRREEAKARQQQQHWEEERTRSHTAATGASPTAQPPSLVFPFFERYSLLRSRRIPLRVCYPTFVVDWHNYGYTLLEATRRPAMVVALYRFLELRGCAGDINLTVSRAMQRSLLKNVLRTSERKEGGDEGSHGEETATRACPLRAGAWRLNAQRAVHVLYDVSPSFFAPASRRRFLKEVLLPITRQESKVLRQCTTTSAPAAPASTRANTALFSSSSSSSSSPGLWEGEHAAAYRGPSTSAAPQSRPTTPASPAATSQQGPPAEERDTAATGGGGGLGFLSFSPSPMDRGGDNDGLMDNEEDDEDELHRLFRQGSELPGDGARNTAAAGVGGGGGGPVREQGNSRPPAAAGGGPLPHASEGSSKLCGSGLVSCAAEGWGIAPPPPWVLQEMEVDNHTALLRSMRRQQQYQTRRQRHHHRSRERQKFPPPGGSGSSASLDAVGDRSASRSRSSRSTDVAHGRDVGAAIHPATGEHAGQTPKPPTMTPMEKKRRTKQQRRKRSTSSVRSSSSSSPSLSLRSSPSLSSTSSFVRSSSNSAASASSSSSASSRGPTEQRKGLILVGSTSWTPDDDYTILVEALQRLDLRLNHWEKQQQQQLNGGGGGGGYFSAMPSGLRGSAGSSSGHHHHLAGNSSPPPPPPPPPPHSRRRRRRGRQQRSASAALSSGCHLRSPLDLWVLITGKGPSRDRFEAQVRCANLSDHVVVSTVYLQSYLQYSITLGAADAGLCLHRSSSGLDLPMKGVDMIGAGLPVLALEYEAIPELLGEEVRVPPPAQGPDLDPAGHVGAEPLPSGAPNASGVKAFTYGWTFQTSSDLEELLAQFVGCPPTAAGAAATVAARSVAGLAPSNPPAPHSLRFPVARTSSNNPGSGGGGGGGLRSSLPSSPLHVYPAPLSAVGGGGGGSGPAPSPPGAGASLPLGLLPRPSSHASSLLSAAVSSAAIMGPSPLPPAMSSASPVAPPLAAAAAEGGGGVGSFTGSSASFLFDESGVASELLEVRRRIFLKRQAAVRRDVEGAAVTSGGGGGGGQQSGKLCPVPVRDTAATWEEQWNAVVDPILEELMQRMSV